VQSCMRLANSWHEGMLAGGAGPRVGCECAGLHVAACSWYEGTQAGWVGLWWCEQGPCWPRWVVACTASSEHWQPGRALCVNLTAHSTGKEGVYRACNGCPAACKGCPAACKVPGCMQGVPGCLQWVLGCMQGLEGLRGGLLQ